MNKTGKIILLTIILAATILLLLPIGDISIRIIIFISSILLTIIVYLMQKAKENQLKPKEYVNYGNIDTKVCPICKTVNNDKRVYCRHCNTPIKNITCPVCNALNPFDNKYCENCDSILRNKTRY